MFMIFGVVRLIVLTVTAIVAYVLSSIALYRIAKNNGVDHLWLAFVPILQYYVVGSLCEEYRLFGVNIKPLSALMPLLILLQVLLGASSSFFAFIPSLILSAVIALIMHKFFYLLDPGKAVILAILCIFGRLVTAIVLFYIMDLRVQMSPGAYVYPFEDKFN